MDEDWVTATKPSQIVREALVIPKPGLGMLGLSLGGLVAGGLMFMGGIGLEFPLLIVMGLLAGLSLATQRRPLANRLFPDPRRRCLRQSRHPRMGHQRHRLHRPRRHVANRRFFRHLPHCGRFDDKDGQIHARPKGNDHRHECPFEQLISR